jgi:DNA-binding MarR family transcriptional regulator
MPLPLKPLDALQLMKGVTVDVVRTEPMDLTQRQLAILLIVYLEMPPHTVRGLASRLGVAKPVITRALDTMGRHGLVKRRRDERDRRNVLVQRTVEGALHLDRIADRVLARAREIAR